MRIWDVKLIPHLCNKHLGAMWCEGLTLYSIIVNGKRGWQNSPMRLEFEQCPIALWEILLVVREERIRRGLFAKEMPAKVYKLGKRIPFQTVEKQIEVLTAKRESIKSCSCDVEAMS